MLLALSFCVPAGILFAQSVKGQQADYGLQENGHQVNATFLDLEPGQLLAWLADLDNPSLAERNRAEKNLLALGMPLLQRLQYEDIPAEMGIPETAEMRYRLNRIRKQLLRNATDQMLMATQVKWSEPAKPSQYSDSVFRQTGNRVLLPKTALAQDGDESRAAPDQSPLVKSQTFWESVSGFCNDNGLILAPLESTQGRLALTNRGERPEAKIATSCCSVLRVDRLNINASDLTQARLRIWWEPRIRVLNLRIPMSEVSLLDRDGVDWGRFNKDAVYSIPTADDRVSVDLRLPVQQIDDSRELEQINLVVELKSLGPDAVCRFVDVSTAARTGQKIHQAAVGVSIDGLDGADGKTRVRLRADYDRRQMAEPLRSHSDWKRYCHGELRESTGKSIVAVEVRQLQQQPFSYVIEYTFPVSLDQVKHHDLIFRIPSGIISSEIKVGLGAGATSSTDN